MKRLGAYIFLLFYVFSICPDIAQIHFCGESIKAVQIVGSENEMDCCGEKKCCDCCQNIVVSADTDDHSFSSDYVATDVDFNLSDAIKSTIFYSYQRVLLSAELPLVYHPPPKSTATKRYIQYGQLVFYA